VCVAFFSNVDMFSLIVISVFGLICFAVVVSWGAAATKVCGEAKGDNADANDVANKKPSKNSEITGRTAVKRPEPSNGKDKHTDREDNVWCIANYYFWKITKALDSIGGLITALATVALVAVTIGLVVIANKSDETSRITNRAYVFLQDISLVNDGQNWHLIPQWVNGGNITTEDMKMRINFVGLTGPTGIKSTLTSSLDSVDATLLRNHRASQSSLGQSSHLLFPSSVPQEKNLLNFKTAQQKSSISGEDRLTMIASRLREELLDFAST
jgi:hypothetical protein